MLRGILYDIHRGRVDKLPPCCIAWYSLIWGRLSGLSQNSKTNLKLWNKYVQVPYDRFIKFGLRARNKDENISWHRIPCPRCVFKGEPSEPS